jgi:hypothetical protein
MTTPPVFVNLKAKYSSISYGLQCIAERVARGTDKYDAVEAPAIWPTRLVGNATISLTLLALSLGTPETHRTLATVSTHGHGRFSQGTWVVCTAV